MKTHETAEALPREFGLFTETDTQRQCPEPYLNIGNMYIVPCTELEELLIISHQNSLIMTGPFSKGLS